MFDIGWSELLVLGVVALLVVGPKELPGLFRTVGQYVGKARSMAREFQRSMEDAARDVDGGALTQLREAKRDLDKMARVDFAEQAKRTQNSLMTGKKSPEPPRPGASDGTAATDAAPKAAAPQPPPEVKPEPAAAAPAQASDAKSEKG